MTDTHTRNKRNTPSLKATVKAVIPLPADRVFDYLSELENNPEWNWSVTATTPLIPGSPRSGSRYTQTSTAEPDHPQILEITYIERPRLLEVEATGHRSTATYRYRLASSEEGTRLMVHAIVRPGHPVGIPALYVQRLQAGLRGNIDNLRSILTPTEERAGEAI